MIMESPHSYRPLTLARIFTSIGKKDINVEWFHANQLLKYKCESIEIKNRKMSLYEYGDPEPDTICLTNMAGGFTQGTK